MIYKMSNLLICSSNGLVKTNADMTDFVTDGYSLKYLNHLSIVRNVCALANGVTTTEFERHQNMNHWKKACSYSKRILMKMAYFSQKCESACKHLTVSTT